MVTAASFFLFSVACKAPFQITDIKVSDSCGMLCISWTTNCEAKCKVSFCDSLQCYATDEEPEWGVLHNITIPRDAHDIKIYAESIDGQRTSSASK